MDKHIDQPAIELNLASSVSPKELAILALHGRNQGPEFIEGIVRKLGWHRHAVVMPVAAGQSWYPERFMAPIKNNELHLNDALATLRLHHKKLNESGFKNNQIVLLGFSQGACLVAQYALLHPSKYRAIIVLTGGYIGEEGIDWKFNGDFEQTPVFISTSEKDEWVPASRTSETARQFSKLNADVNLQLYSDRLHEVSEKEIEIVGGML